MRIRPFLTARWTNLVFLNFPVPTAAIEALAPAGTEPDLHNGQAYVSIVAFHFDAVRICGVAVPGHTRFPEINLRFYVRRYERGELRRGVVFIREIAPRRAVGVIAKWFYNENYITRPMRYKLPRGGAKLSPGDTLEYAWRSRRSQLGSPRWNHVTAQVAAPLAPPTAGSLEEFIVEHYWGYARSRDGSTREYRVAHDPWSVAPAANVMWDGSTFVPFLPRKCMGTAHDSLAECLARPPVNAIIAAGSAIQLQRGERLRECVDAFSSRSLQ